MSREKLLPQSEVARERRVNRIYIPLAATALSAAALFAGHEVLASQAPQFSEETSTYTVHKNDTLWKISEAVEGSERFDRRDTMDYIRYMPQNKTVFEDNILSPGEVVTYPDKVE